MQSATFFGHRDYNYLPFKEKIRAIIIELIEKKGVKTFYNGFRGNFDHICAEIVFELKTRYPFIKNIMVLSYLNRQHFVLPKYFDESIYLLEKHVPPQYSISYTNQEMVLKADYIVSGVRNQFGGAYTARNFAKRKKKIIFDLFEDNDNSGQ